MSEIDDIFISKSSPFDKKVKLKKEIMKYNTWIEYMPNPQKRDILRKI